MNIALLDKDLFASLLKFGEIKIPDFLCSKISDELSEEDALSIILNSCNPVEYPSEHIIVRYNNADFDKIAIGNIIELIATNPEGKRTFESQFRDDLLISEGRYSHIFETYKEQTFESARIRRGIMAFRTLCGLEEKECYDEVEEISCALKARLTYRHHYHLPEDYYNSPYLLMMVYDRHAPYPSSWVGFFYDVIETFCYHVQPKMGYKDAPIEHTQIYRLIASLDNDVKTHTILATIEKESFTIRCNEFFNKPGGLLVPYLFFILRAYLRNCESFSQMKTIVSNIKSIYPEAFDTACTYAGGFFGYDKFYDDLYSSLNLQIFKVISDKLEDRPKPKGENSVRPAQTANPDPSSHSEKLFHKIAIAMKDAFDKKQFTQLKEKLLEFKEDLDKLSEIDRLATSNKLSVKAFNHIFNSRYKQKSIDKFVELYRTNSIWN
jgi:hypothetical protein